MPFDSPTISSPPDLQMFPSCFLFPLVPFFFRINRQENVGIQARKGLKKEKIGCCSLITYVRLFADSQRMIRIVITKKKKEET